MKEFLWTEKYRPKTVDDCILPDRLKQPFLDYVAKKQIPNIILSGTSGVGKTTIARAVCEEIGLDYLFINSSKDRGIDTLRYRITAFASTLSMSGMRKVVILDESDYLTAEAQAALRHTMEEFSHNCTFILTCNLKEKLTDAIKSRTTDFTFRLKKSEKVQMAQQFFKRICAILDLESIEYDKQIVAKLVENYFPDYRRTLNEIQRLSSYGSIKSMAMIEEITNIDQLFDALKKKDFSTMRKWVVDNSDADPNTIYRLIYDNMTNYFEGSSVPQAVLTIAQYQYQTAFVVDKEINLVACLTQLAGECSFK